MAESDKCQNQTKFFINVPLSIGEKIRMHCNRENYRSCQDRHIEPVV